MTLQLRNPHSVLAALTLRPSDVSEVVSDAGAEESATGGWSDVVRLAAAQGVPLHPPGRGRGGRGDGSRAGASYATVKERQPVALPDLVADMGPRDLFLALDQIQDPQNVGAIFRLASFYGVRGLVMTKSRAAPLTSAAYDVASGGVETVPFVTVSNLRRALDSVREAGVWVLGATEHSETPLDEITRDRAWVVVLGNEEQGLRRLTLEACDATCRIVPRGEAEAAVRSLNVAAAAAVCLSALSRP